jgi:hypothetical protein
MLKYILTFGFALLYISTSAQIEKIETDRPGQTNTPSTTPSKWLQTEIGFQKQTSKFYYTLKDKYIQHPSLLTKYGIGKKFEVRLITELASQKYEYINGNFTDKGFNNTQIGGKFNFLKEKGVIPKTAIIAHYRLNRLNTNPIGYDTINGGNIRFAMLHTVSENFYISYNFGLDMRSWDYDPMYLYTFSPKFNIAENWQAYIEIYGYIRKGRIPQTSIDGGVSYYINDNLKIDAAVGLRINKNTNIKFYSIGASFRFKTSKED